MTKKDLIYNFLENLGEGTTTLKDAWELFKKENPEFDKATFSSYRSKAIKDGKFVPLKNVKKTAVTPLNNNEMKAEYKTIDLNNINSMNFKTLPTGTTFDKIASKRDALMSSTTYIITGESGAGKTTIATNLGDYIVEQNPDKTIGFISCEMDELDWTEECLDNPRLSNIPTIFMLEYLDATNYVEILKKSLCKFDYAILDSFEVVIDQFRDIMGWTAKKAESELINIMRQAASETGTCIMAIQQYTKGGTFVGSNKIKHMLTGMMFVKFDENGNRYVEFIKNRRGGSKVNKRVYFTKNKETGRIEFDERRFERMEKMENFQEKEKENIENEEDIFESEILQKAKEKEDARKKVLENA